MKHLGLLLFFISGMMYDMGSVTAAPAYSGGVRGAVYPNGGTEELVDEAVFLENAALKNANVTATPKLPAGFGHYNGSKVKSAWGSTEKEAHSGKRSVYMEIKGDDSNANIDLLLAPSDGYSGKGAIEVQKNTDYYVSFWAKGNIKSISLRLFQWKTSGITQEDRGANPTIPVAIPLTDTWQKFEGKFRVGPGIARIAVGIHAYGAVLAGQMLYVDDVSFTELGNATAAPESSGGVRVAIYDNGKFNVFGHEHIRAALAAESGFTVSVIDTLAPATLKDVDVLILSVIDTPSKKDAGDSDRGVPGIDWVLSLLNFLDSGKGLILGHSAAGYRGMFDATKIIPDVAIGKGKADWLQELTVTAAAHPVMSGVPPKFTHAYFDHITLKPGPKGTVLAADAAGDAAIVAGEVSRGRVVAIGYPMGLATKPESKPKSEGYLAALPVAERQVLVNAVRWAGSAAKFDVPMDLTAVTLVAEVKRYNDALREAQLARFKDLPPPRFDESIIWTYIYTGGPVGMNLDTEDKIVTVVENCKRMAFTTVLCETKTASFMYPSEVYPKESRRNCKNGFDPIGTLVRESRKRGMKVGLVLYPFSNLLEWGDYPPNIMKDEADKIARGELTTAKLNATTPWWKQNCPDSPAVRERAMKITEEIIQRYNPDIIYLDYIRYKDSYETSCYCDYSLKQKEAFAKAHPEYTAPQVIEQYSMQSLIGFVAEWVALCKKLNPKIVTTCYTISSPSCKAPSWVNKYPTDRHAKYVSRYLSGPESTLDDIAALTEYYTRWCAQVNPRCVFSPIVSSYDKKTPERVYTELKVLSAALDKMKVSRKVYEYYDYVFLMKAKGDYNIDEDMIQVFNRANTGR